MPEISQKARQVLEYLTQRESSIPPSVREIGAALQIKSTSTVHKYLTELAAAGYIEKGDKMNRAISLPQQNSTRVPLLGVVTAGQPILAVEEIEGYVPVDCTHPRSVRQSGKPAPPESVSPPCLRAGMHGMGSCKMQRKSKRCRLHLHKSYTRRPYPTPYPSPEIP